MTFTCKAINGLQSSIRYTWYRLSRVKIPPDETDNLGITDNTITVINVSKTDDRFLFQCCAESAGQVIFSDVAKVTIDCKYFLTL